MDNNLDHLKWPPLSSKPDLIKLIPISGYVLYAQKSKPQKDGIRDYVLDYLFPNLYGSQPSPSSM